MRKLILGFVLMIAACGAPSRFDLCHELCDVNKRCGLLSDAQAANCHTDCNNNKGALADEDAQCERDCTNCAKIRSELGACGGQECNKVVQCVQNVDQTCIRK